MGEARRRALRGLQPRQVKAQVPIEELKDRVCECSCKAFTQVYGLKEIPSLYSPSGKMETMMLHVGFVCIACGKLMSLTAGQELPGTGVEGTGKDDGDGEKKPQEESNLVKLGG
jgi:hypothetical protein